MKPWAGVTVFINLVRKVLALGDGESLARKKIRLAREQADAVNAVTLRLGHQRLHQPSAAASPLSRWRNGDGANFRQMRPIKVQCSAADDAALVLEHHKVADV